MLQCLTFADKYQIVNTKYTLRITCNDEKGLIYKISGILLQNNLNIERNDEYVDSEKNLFFMRSEIAGDCNIHDVDQQIKSALPENSNVSISQNKPRNVVVLVTKEHHCLSDLLIRNQYKELNFNIVAVIGNYNILANLTKKFDIPFHNVPSEGISREEHEQLIINVLEAYSFDYIILAKFMRILTPNFVKKYERQIVNIHHSFLPAFIGANPYKQAFQRGVKMIGATSHFVTDDLDEGPIIYQDISKVNHSQTAKDLAKIGREVEKKVLSEALKLVFDDKVFIDGNKTIVFD